MKKQQYSVPWGRVGLTGLLLASSAAYADISGKVFRDFNGNGVFDSGAGFNEVGAAGVTVKAFDSSGVEKATTTSGADGTYTLTGLAAGADYRVEFSWAESWLKPGAAGGTSVQFAKDGATAVNFGLNDPDDFSQDNPQVMVSNFAVGIPEAPEVASKPRLLEFSYQSGGLGRNYNYGDMKDDAPPSINGTGNAMPTAGANRSRIDSVLMGQVGSLFGLAFHRESNTVLAAAYMKRFVGFPNGKNDAALGTIYAVDRDANPNSITPFFTANAGEDLHDYSRSDLSAPSGDKAAASQVGKVGWGDIDLSPDGKTLYAINLFDKKIYQIPVITTVAGLTAGTPTLIDYPNNIKNGLCSNNDWVSGGLKVAHDSVYVTVTCTAEISQQQSDLRHYVYKFQVDNPAVFSQVLSIPNYARSGSFVFSQWRPWVADADPLAAGARSYDQPWLMDIEFDDTGRMILGMKNRTADMLPSNDGNFFFSFGDTLAATPNSDGTYSLTTNEFVDDDAGHAENDMGMLAVLRGSGTLITPAHIGDLYQGIRTYLANAPLTATAAKTITPYRYYSIHQTPRAVTVIGDPFGKVAGLGDIEVLANPAPIEIGNRVWRDANGNGIQDAGEAGIDGVEVALTCGSDVATTSTSNGGQFLFSNKAGGNATFMNYGEDCELAIADSQSALSGLQLTTANADSKTNNDAVQDVRDSDATAESGKAVIRFKSGSMGENNHGLDVGYRTPATHSLGNRVWIDLNNNGKADSGENHAGEGIKLELRDKSGTKLADTLTDANGRYLFHGLAAGEYQVCVTADNFAAGGKLAKHRSSTGQANADSNSEDGVDRGDDDLSDGACSTITVLNDQEPIKEYGFTDQQDGDDGKGTPDANSNLTIDFGFVPPTDIELSKTVDKTSIKPGETVTYTLIATNKSPVTATGVKVSEQLPARATLVDVNPSQGTFAGSEWAVGTLAAGASVTLTLKVKID